MRSPQETVKEAIAREIEHLSRGYVAHEATILLDVAKRIRDTVYAPTATIIDVVLGAADVIIAMKHDERWAWYQYWGHPDGLFHRTYARLSAINILDPMEPFSDKAQWWPRESPPVPEWVTNAIHEITLTESSVVQARGDLKRESPAYNFASGNLKGLANARNIIYKHMPARPV